MQWLQRLGFLGASDAATSAKDAGTGASRKASASPARGTERGGSGSQWAETRAMEHEPSARGSGGQAPREPKQPAPKKRIPTVAERKRMTVRPPSFSEQLPYVNYDPSDNLFVLRDGSTMGMMFDLGPVPTEAQEMDYLVERANKVQESLQAIPESDTTPWVCQFFLNDDRDISPLNDYLRDYIAEQHKNYPKRQADILASPLTQNVLAEFEQHLRLVSRPQGLFVDTLVSGQVWRGQQRRVRCCVYRRFRRLAEDSATAKEQLEAVAISMVATLGEAGVTARRCTGRDLYQWLLPFFNRNVPWASGYTGELMEKVPYPGDAGDSHTEDGRPAAPVFGLDLAEMLNLSEPYSNMDKGCFEFDGVPVKALTLQGLRTQPNIGHFSAERMNGKEAFARFDRLPPGSMLSISITVSPQHKLEHHIERIRDASRANTAAARETHSECERVLERMILGDKLMPMMMTLYVTAPTYEELQASISQTNALLIPSGLRFIEQRNDLVPLDAFLRGLPFNFDPAFDNKDMRRSRLTFASHIAALLPVYGRSRGTPHPGMWFWNRGGEPLFVDPLNKKDRKKNAHLLMLGPTGAGKSATLNYLTLMAMAIHKPRFVIADAGKSFDLLMQYFKAMGLVTHSVTLTSETNVSLPPFLYAGRLLKDKEVMLSFYAAEKQARINSGLPEDPGLFDLIKSFLPKEAILDETGHEIDLTASIPADAEFELIKGSLAGSDKAPFDPEATRAGLDLLLEDLGGPQTEPSAQAGTQAGEVQAEEESEEKRDYLGEMLISAVMMITGGEQQEIERMTRADRYLVSRAIIKAAIKARSEGIDHPLVQHVAIELMGMASDESLSPPRRQRGEEMGQSMMTFTQGLRGKLFNRPGSDWPDADVTLVEMGTLTQDGYGDALAVAYTSLIDSVQSRGERFQAEDRPLVMLTDEGHLITTNDLLGPKIAKGTKMWRKLNIWFWLATQNLKDFPDSMSRVLSMCEYWILLTMDKSEIEEVARFRSLTTEQRKLMESAKKEPPKYTEGVLLSAGEQLLFRNVPPALPIALAMTEGHEKAHRRRIMQRLNCTELEAAMEVARELTAKRG